MIIYVSLMATHLVDQAAQVPVIVQCGQTAQEPGWKWWLKLMAEILGPLLSTAGSIYVAWRLFRWQGQKDRKQWIRDHKMEEWKNLIQLAAEYERIMPLGQPGSSTVDAVRRKVLPLCDRISQLISESLFIAPALTADEVRLRLKQIMEETDWAIGRIEIFPQSSEAEKVKLNTPIENAFEIRRGLEALHRQLLSVARQDLALDSVAQR